MVLLYKKVKCSERAGLRKGAIARKWSKMEMDLEEANIFWVKPDARLVRLGHTSNANHAYVGAAVALPPHCTAHSYPHNGDQFSTNYLESGCGRFFSERFYVEPSFSWFLTSGNVEQSRSGRCSKDAARYWE